LSQKKRLSVTTGETYITERGILLDTFKAYGGEFGDARDFATIARRLNRDPAKGLIFVQSNACPIAPVGVWTVTVKSDDENDDESDEDTEAPAPQIKLNPIFEYFQLANRKVFWRSTPTASKTPVSATLKSGPG
jgi:hypothetical protein